MKTFGQIDHEKRIYHIVLNGFASPEQKEWVAQAFKKAISTITPKDYSLVFDCRKLATFKPELLPELELYYKFYMKMGFKNIIIIKPQHLPSAMQLERVAKKVNFSPVFIQTEEEVALHIAS
jgi:hypothetical protein